MQKTQRRLRVAICCAAGALVLATADTVSGDVTFKTWPAAYRWHTFSGSSDPDGGGGVAVDRALRVTRIGFSYAAWMGPAAQAPLHAFSSGGPNGVVVQTDSDGAYLWHTFFPGALNGISEDFYGNIYLTGSSHGSWVGPAGQAPLHAHPGGAGAIVVMKLDASGAYRWHTFYGSGHANYNNNGMGVAADDSGNLAVTGDSAGGGWAGPSGQAPRNPFTGFQDTFVLRLDANGAYQWHAFYGSGNDGGRAIAVDAWGIDVMGYSGATWNGPAGKAPLNPYHGDASHRNDIFVLKLDTNGTYGWHTFYGSGSDTGFGITPASAAGLGMYITGRSGAAWNGPAGQAPRNAYHGDAANPNDILVLKLSRDGAYQWHTFYGSGSDAGYGVATGLDTVFVTGTSNATWTGPAGQPPANPVLGGGSTAFLTLGTDGAYRWHSFYGSATSGASVAVSSGAVYVAGTGSSAWNGPAGQPPLHAPAGGGDLLLMKVVPECPALVLSDEGAGFIAMLLNAGYGEYSLYDASVAIQTLSDPSVAGIITDAFLETLASCPASSQIFTTRLKNVPASGAVAISDDGTSQLVDLRGASYLVQPGTATLKSVISGVGTALFTYATDPNVPLTTFNAGGTAYHVFAVAWAPKRGSLRRVIPRQRAGG
jgi:hypothetical protein